MAASVESLSLARLSLIFVPALLVVVVMFYWSLRANNALYAMARMLGQLLLIGYFLTFLFEAESVWIVLGVLTIMISASSWIALNNSSYAKRQLFRCSLGAIALSGSIVLAIVVVGVLGATPWYEPRLLIPLAGMIFANSMTSVSLTIERLEAELKRGDEWLVARATALHAGLIPLINSLFAVGLVSLPGMMTGQILAGVSPLIAARYQIMVMCMVFASGGFSIFLFVVFAKRIYCQASSKLTG
jgi:putative ABC transport system permease protein